MSKVRLYGDTSGFVDLKAPDVASNVTITLPNTAGPFATETYADAAGVAGSGLVAVKSAIFTGTQSTSTASGANFAVTDLTITHACADAANKLILMTTVGALTNSIGTLESGLAFHDGTSLIGVGATAGSRLSVSTGGFGKESGAGNGISAFPQAFTLVHTPGDTSSRTYTVRAFNTFSTTQTISVNRSVSDTDAVRYVRAASTFTLMEVKV